jgi:hypothetical protein
MNIRENQHVDIFLVIFFRSILPASQIPMLKKKSALFH